MPSSAELVGDAERRHERRARSANWKPPTALVVAAVEPERRRPIETDAPASARPSHELRTRPAERHDDERATNGAHVMIDSTGRPRHSAPPATTATPPRRRPRQHVVLHLAGLDPPQDVAAIDTSTR